MKIIEFVAENVKRLKVVRIKPDGNMVEITGGNGEGKSSVLDSIYYAMTGKNNHPSEVIRSGEDEAHIKLDFGEMIVRRKFHKRAVVKKNEEDPDETRVLTSLVVETAEGAKYPSPQRMLDKLVGSISFDPLEFARMEPRDQYEVLKRICGIDNEPLEEANKSDYQDRIVVNRQVRNLFAQAEAIDVPDDAPTEEMSIAGLVEEMRLAQDFNDTLDMEKGRRNNRRARHGHLETEIEGIEQEIAALQDKIRTRKEEMQAIQKDIKNEKPLLEQKDVQAIQTKLAGAEEHNGLVRRKREKMRLMSTAKEAEAEAERISKRMQDRADQMRKNIEDADMPVPGLLLADGHVKYQESPESEAHSFDVLSDALQLQISCAIVMRQNPKLRVIRIRDGSLLDEFSMEVLKKMAKDSDFQIWIERVDTSGKVGIVISDGEVVEQIA